MQDYLRGKVPVWHCLLHDVKFYSEEEFHKHYDTEHPKKSEEELAKRLQNEMQIAKGIQANLDLEELIKAKSAQVRELRHQQYNDKPADGKLAKIIPKKSEL